MRGLVCRKQPEKTARSILVCIVALSAPKQDGISVRRDFRQTSKALTVSACTSAHVMPEWISIVSGDVAMSQVTSTLAGAAPKIFLSVLGLGGLYSCEAPRMNSFHVMTPSLFSSHAAKKSLICLSMCNIFMEVSRRLHCTCSKHESIVHLLVKVAHVLKIG